MMSSSLLVSFLTTLLMAGAVCIQGQQEPVRDTAGNSLETGQQYFIQPVNKGGGLVPSSRIFPLCPLNINQALLPSQPGLPVSFAFPNSDTNTIVTTSTDVTIEFKSEFWPFCNEFSKFWEVDNTSTEEPREILIGGQRGSINSTFKIVKIGEGTGPITYKLTTFIGNVVTTSAGFPPAPKLVVTGDNDDAKALIVKFKKFDDATTSTSPIDRFGLRMFPFY